MSGGGSFGLGGSKSSSQQSASTFLNANQADALKRLYGLGFDTYNNNPYQGNIYSAANAANAGLAQVPAQLQQYIAQQQNGGAYGNTDVYRQRLLDMSGQRSNMGSMYESIVGGNGNTYVDPLIQRMREDTAQNNQRFMGSNELQAAQYGQSGSSRQAMADAMYANQANRDLMTQEASMRQQAYDRDLQMKMGIAQQADTNRQAEMDRYANLIGGAQTAQNNVGNLYPQLTSANLAQMVPYLQGQQSQFDPIQYLSNVIGPAIMEGQSQGSSKAKAAQMSGSANGGIKGGGR